MKLASRLTAFVLFLAVLGLGISGIHRSLWLDETWVANSIQSSTLHGMFYYPGWLQVTPPLYLLLARACVHLTGASNAAFRAVPLLFSLAAVGLLLGLGRRLLAPGLAALATAIVVFEPAAIEYSHTLKPYSAELAAAAGLLLLAARYLERPDSRRAAWLAVAAVIAIPLAYSSVFLLPGIVLAAFFTRKSHGLAITAAAGTVLLATYVFFIRPNSSPALRQFFAADAGRSSLGLLAALALCVFAAIYLGSRLARGDKSARTRICAICLLPCLLLAAAATLGWYPMSSRTRLFALPCFVLLAAMLFEDATARLDWRGVSAIAATALTFGLAGYAIAARIVGPGDTFEEDFDGAVSFLARHAAPSDLILVHACCKEGFLLYSRMDHWNPPHVVFGDTGWPCCVPGKDSFPGSSTRSAVIADLDGKLPRGYSGRVWLFYITRPTHWSYIGLDEGDLWRGHVWERGCPPGPYIRFANLAVSPMDCVAGH